MTANIKPEIESLAVPIDTLEHHPMNPRVGDVPKIRSSLKYFGQMRPILVQASTRFIVAGNHTTKAARDEGWTEIAASIIDMSDEEALAYLLMDNKAADSATYDDQGLMEALRLAEANSEAMDFEATGFDVEELRALEQAFEQSGSGEDGLERDGTEVGSKLDLADIAIEDPKTQLHKGSAVRLGPHQLLVVGVYEASWSRLLAAMLEDDPSTLFVPYPTPSIPLTGRAKSQPILFVQPDTYIAGHMVDKWIAINGEDDVSIGEAEDLQ